MGISTKTSNDTRFRVAWVLSWMPATTSYVIWLGVVLYPRVGTGFAVVVSVYAPCALVSSR